MSGWLNEPIEIIEDYRVLTESQLYWVSPGVSQTRSRKTTWTTIRYVGCEYAAAKVKADALSATAGYTDVHLTPAGGGQYHVLATQTVKDAWSAWA